MRPSKRYKTYFAASYGSTHYGGLLTLADANDAKNKQLLEQVFNTIARGLR